MPRLRFEPWLLNEQNAKILGLPAVALTPAAQLAANGRESVWFDSEALMAIWQGPSFQHGFPAGSLGEALDRVGRLDVG
jgi:hypothetical protein